MKTIDAMQIAHGLMEEHGLFNWNFKFDNAKSRFGYCHYPSRTISLSRALTERNSESIVRNVILHEIAHALAPFGSGHNQVWKETARSIGCDGMRCYNSAVVSAPRKKFTGQCPNCKKVIKRHRRTRISCGKCDTVFNSQYLIQWSAR